MSTQTKARQLPATQSMAKPKGKVGRPPSHRTPDAVRLRSGASLSFRTLRRWHSALTEALASPRGASTVLTLTDLRADIAALLGPAMDPDHVPEAARKAIGYVVTKPDGTEHRFKLAKQAAELLGVTRGSMMVMLSQSGGAYSRNYAAPDRPMETWKVRRIMSDERT